MESIGYLLGMVSFVYCLSLSAKVSKMERLIKNAGIGDSRKSSLKEILEKNIGKTVKIEFENELDDTDILSNKCFLEDIDEDWVLIKIVKNEMQKLIRIDSIKSIQLI